MAEPTKAEIQTIFKRLRSIQTNKQCFDCGAKNPTWASVTYGVFLCIDCSAVHRALGVHVTFIRSTQLDVFTWLQLRAMQLGGNANAMAFFRQHGVSTTDAHRKYTSRAAGMYKEKVNKLAIGAMRKYGTDIHISEIAHAQSPKEKEVDFFQEHTESTPSSVVKSASNSIQLETASEASSQPVPIKNGNGNGNGKKVDDDPTKGPNVEAALSISPTQALSKPEPRKSTIGQRKPQSAKKGLGTRKGLGAQKVKANFADLESAAQQADRMKEESVKQKAAQAARTKEEEEANMASMRLAYQDMSLELKKQEEKMKAADPKKAQQMERLGMGFGGRTAISHSATTDMKVIEQVSPIKEQSRSSRSSNRGDFFDEFDLGNSRGSSSSSSRFKDEEEPDEDEFFSSFGASKSSSKSTSSAPKQSSYDSIAPLDDSRARSKKDYSSSSSSGSNDAMKRFANAKSISSDQYFGKKDEMDYETRTNLEKYSASGSISSDQLFGRETQSSAAGATDMGAIKDGMKDGVTQVAGKLSRMANGLYTSIQDRYGY
ncbi:ADP-ribosylation factor GTPase-activating protein 2-like isoform X2 [Amphiura filiformis]|uniref:ADP-ribosylation factor GTPase-activating protein 2-like isoform X2 n=1 Tax=Amphiura filiformis TaxID=82378 RepID=UPI003B224E25